MVEEFCRKYDVLVIIAAHPTKPPKEIGKTKLKEAGFYDIRGTGDWYDMAYYGLSVYRDLEDDYSYVRVMKCKFKNLGENGAKVCFKYNSNNGRYIPIDSEPEPDYTPSFEYDNSYWLDENTTQENFEFYENVSKSTNYESRFNEKYNSKYESCGFNSNENIQAKIEFNESNTTNKIQNYDELADGYEQEFPNDNLCMVNRTSNNFDSSVECDTLPF
ncbi:hypothetical protein MHBO_004476 [Bonamia ostreae]|uniref:Uncharacterized protein n=1 Tax=Bonamia ostreae TaxID=126728 RepID=A0ABV2ATE5_9EUKA